MFQHPVDKPNQERMSKTVCNTVKIKLLTGALPVALIGMNIEQWWIVAILWVLTSILNFHGPYFHWIVMNCDQLQYVDTSILNF